MAEKLAIHGGTPVIEKQYATWPIWDETDVEKVAEVVRSGVWGIDAAAIDEFAERFAAFQHVKHAWPVANGTLAIQLALMALHVGCGDEVIVPDYTFMATAAAPMHLGAKPVLVDVDRDTFCLDPALTEAAVTDKTRAIIPVHLGGHPCDMAAIMDIATKYDLHVIEDSAHAHGAIPNDQYVGTFGDIGTFSFQSSKTLPAGEGGIIVTECERLYKTMKSLLNTGRAGMSADYDHYLCGTNYRIGGLQAGLLLGQLDRLEEQADRRDRNAQVLNGPLAEIDGVRPQARAAGVQRNGHYLYIFVLEEDVPRDRFREALGAEGVPVESEYPAIHALQFIQARGLGTGSFPASDEVAARSVWLCHHGLLGSEDDIAAGIFLGGCLLTVGILIFVMARKVARRGPQPVDLNVVTAVGMAHMMNMSDGDAGFDGGDSGGDFD